MASRRSIEAGASSKTLNKCRTELNRILKQGNFPSTNSPLRQKYHRTLMKLIEDVAETWYQTGFKRCHKTLHGEGRTDRNLIQKEMRMRSQLFRHGTINVTLSSFIKPKKRKAR